MDIRRAADFFQNVGNNPTVVLVFSQFHSGVFVRSEGGNSARGIIPAGAGKGGRESSRRTSVMKGSNVARLK